VTEPRVPLVSERVQLDDDYDGFLALIEERGWSDGLPMVPPTPDRVSKFVAFCTRDPSEVLGRLPPLWNPVTVEKIAINAVMAGCLAEHMPVVLAAIEAVLEEPFNLNGVQATTHPCAVLVLVHGPITTRLGMNWGYGALGPGNRANAAIGRAVRLVLMNVGGAVPGTLDRATLGSPAKYTYCAAENEIASPWPPLRIDLGFRLEDSVVTVVAGESPQNINDHGSADAAGLLRTITYAMIASGHNNHAQQGDVFLLLGPEHARVLASAGYSRHDTQHYLFEHIRAPRDHFGPGQLAFIESHLDSEQMARTHDGLPIAARPEDIQMLIIGGDGRHSAWVPTFGSTKSISRRIVITTGLNG
jgi:hypothetical protein